mmetsp:Transcript_17556/g.45214  ORF Transcript_17556/g.45214 Transcript_17556/m.45214 type:complete len:232 (+) Transcript_17556:307-1002(+)
MWREAGFAGGSCGCGAGAGGSGTMRIRKTLVRGATVMTPGWSTSHFTLATLLSTSTHFRVPENQRPPYSTSTRSPAWTGTALAVGGCCCCCCCCGAGAALGAAFGSGGCTGVMAGAGAVASLLKCWAASNVRLGGPASICGHLAMTTACESLVCTRKIAGSWRPVAAEAISVPTISHELMSCWTSCSPTRPCARALVIKPTISACMSSGTESCMPAPALPSCTGHVAIRFR